MILIVKAAEYILENCPTDLRGNEKTKNFSSKFDVFSQFFNYIHDQVLTDLDVDVLHTEDDFFDYFMTFFEKTNYLKAHLKKYFLQGLKNPSLYIEHIKILRHIGTKLKAILPQMPESYYYTTFAILPAVLYVWVHDESDDLCHTMKKLQQVSSNFANLIFNY